MAASCKECGNQIERVQSGRGRPPVFCSNVCRVNWDARRNQAARAGRRLAPTAPKPPAKRKPNHHEQVQELAGLGGTSEEIAGVIGLSAETVRARYAEQLTLGPLEANFATARNLHRLSLGDGATALNAGKYWLASRAGWSEYAAGPPSVIEVSEPAGKKAKADADAKTAEVGTRWADILQFDSKRGA